MLIDSPRRSSHVFEQVAQGCIAMSAEGSVGPLDSSCV